MQAARGRAPIDLPAAFALRFGKPLPGQFGGPVTFTLIASTFDRRTFNGIEYLQTSGIRVRALRYVRRGRSMNVVPCTAADLNRTAQRASRVGPSDGRRLVAGGRLRPTRFTGTFVTSGRSTRVSSCGSLSRSASFGRVTGNGG